jgi:tetratricopeptide (TPR) repeat protein
MHHPRLISPTLISALLLGLFVCPNSLDAAEPPWLELHSAHFTVITDAGEKKGREVALRFEQMRAVFGSLLGKERLQQSIPLTILAFKNDKSYYQLAPLRHLPDNPQPQPINTPGFFLTSDDQDFIVLNLFEADSWNAVAHDFAVMLLDCNYPPAQGWFDEGLAEYFSSIRIDNKDVEIGADPELNPTIKEDLVGNLQDARPAKSLTELLAAQTWMSPADLFSAKHDPSPRNEGTHHTLYYAESWMMMHYLLHAKKLPETGQYFDLVLNHHVAVEDAIKQAFGMSSAELEQAVKDYFHKQDGLQRAVEDARNQNYDPTTQRYPGQTDHFPVQVGADDSVITVKPMAEADARAVYAGVQTRIPERRDLGLKTLRELATTPTEADKKATEAKPVKKIGEEDPEQLPNNSVGNAVAHRMLAWDYIQHNEFDEAMAEITDAAELNPRDAWIRYYLSVAKYRMSIALHTPMMGVANMMIDLKAVLEWNPEMADAYDLLAVARNTGGGTTAAMQAERAAINLSPRNEMYVYHLAEIYIGAKKWEAADNVLNRLKTSSDPQIVKLAHDLATQTQAERKYGIAINSTGAEPPKYEKQKSPFDVLEEDAAKREAEAKANQPDAPGDARPTKFVKGELVAVDCSKTPVAIVTVAADGRSLKLRAADYKSLLLIGADDFSCDWRNRPVTVNYKAGGLADGDLVSLEVR